MFDQSVSAQDRHPFSFRTRPSGVQKMHDLRANFELLDLELATVMVFCSGAKEILTI
jgi:hypothetical protein